jgi:hypothetical protein
MAFINCVAMGGCPVRLARLYFDLGSVAMNDKVGPSRMFVSIAAQITTARSGPPSNLTALRCVCGAEIAGAPEIRDLPFGQIRP